MSENISNSEKSLIEILRDAVKRKQGTSKSETLQVSFLEESNEPLNDGREVILKPGFFKPRVQKPYYPRIGEKPGQEFYKLRKYKTKKTAYIYLLQNGYGNQKELEEITGFSEHFCFTHSWMLAPIYFIPRKELESRTRPRMLSYQFEYRSTELAIIPLKSPDLSAIPELPYWRDFIITCADKLKYVYVGESMSPPTDELIDDGNTLWVEMKNGNEKMYLAWSYCHGYYEEFAKISGWYYKDIYHPCSTFYQLPSLWDYIKINTKQKLHTNKERLMLTIKASKVRQRVLAERALFDDIYLKEIFDFNSIRVSKKDESIPSQIDCDWIVELHGSEQPGNYVTITCTADAIAKAVERYARHRGTTVHGHEDVVSLIEHNKQE